MKSCTSSCAPIGWVGIVRNMPTTPLGRIQALLPTAATVLQDEHYHRLQHLILPLAPLTFPSLLRVFSPTTNALTASPHFRHRALCIQHCRLSLRVYAHRRALVAFLHRDSYVPLERYAWAAGDAQVGRWHATPKRDEESPV